ncbi:6-phosphogluconolactonase (cycloisomerase 2 family), partial [Amycolatopsis bartoniae]
MNLSRRRLLGAAAAVPLLGAIPATAAPRKPDLVYIGTWGREELYGARFDPGTGALTSGGVVADVSSSWAVRHPALPVLYVGSGEGAGVVSSYRIDRTGLTRTSEVSTGGSGTAGVISHLAVHQNTVLVANFAAGLVATVPLGRDGTLGSPTSVVRDTGSGPNPRQAGPHPHHVTVDPSGRWALVADFGADRV